MRKETITYVDYNGQQQTEVFYFNLSRPEAMEFQVSEKEGLDKVIEKIVKTKDNKKMMEIFKNLILKSYGELSPDGKHFIKKNGELAKEFAESAAYEALYMKLVTNDKAAADFFNGIIPQLSDTEKQQIEKQKAAMQ